MLKQFSVIQGSHEFRVDVIRKKTFLGKLDDVMQG